MNRDDFKKALIEKNVHKVVVSLSGGLDSTTLAYLMVDILGKDNVYCLSMNYSQRHDVELECAKATCKKLGVYHKIIDIGFLGEIVSSVSAMVKGEVKTPTFGEVNAAKEVKTYVPFRNSILSSITFAFAESMGADGIALGIQYGDYENNEAYYYWDTSSQFQEAMQALADLNDKHKISYVAPFVQLTKKDEIELGKKLGVDYSLTWTCYNPTITNFDNGMHKMTPCGVCPSCVGRTEAFHALGMEDPQKGMTVIPFCPQKGITI